MSEPEFLTLDTVLALHADQIRRYGGTAGLRDLGLLRSAIAMPETTFDGEYLHTTPFEQAAAYLFHIARNHPFVDGNKRTGFVLGVLLLELNGFVFDAAEEDAARAVIALAAGELDEAGYAAFLRDGSHAEGSGASRR